MNLRLAVAALLAMTSSAVAAEFPSSVVLKIGATAASSWDVVGHIVADHLGRHLPGQPDIKIEIVDGGRGAQLVRQLVETEPRDGSVAGMVTVSVLQGYVVDPTAYDFKPVGLNWVGSLAKTVALCVRNAASEVSLTDSGLSFGALNKASSFYALAAIARHLINDDAEIIIGFKSENELMAALDRGEIDVYCGTSYSTYKREGREATQAILGGIGVAEKLAELAVDDVFASATGVDRQVITLLTSSSAHFYGMALPAGTDAETIGIYRKAFAEMNQDPAFLDEIKANVVEYAPAPGEEVQAAIDGMLATDPAVVARAAEILK